MEIKPLLKAATSYTASSLSFDRTYAGKNATQNFAYGRYGALLHIVAYCLQKENILLFIRFAPYPYSFQIFSLSIEIGLFSLELSGFFITLSPISIIFRGEYKNWTFWLVEKLGLWRYGWFAVSPHQK